MKFVAPFGSTERTLSSGRVVEHGEPFDLSADDQKDPHNARLIAEGHIVPVTKPKKEEAQS